MITFLGLLSLLLFIALIVGLVKPSIILKWDKSPSRIKVFGYWFLSCIILGFLGVAFEDKEELAKNKIESAQKLISENNFTKVNESLNTIEKENKYYSEAQGLIRKSDSLNTLFIEKKKIEVAKTDAKKKDEEIVKQIEMIEREISSINKGIDFSTYRNEVSALQMELVLFSAWKSQINAALEFNNTKLNKLAKILKSKVQKIQIKEFPIIRKNYAKVVHNKMWENDIEVYSSGTGNRYINLIGGVFAANKNKKTIQSQLNEILTMFRFKQSRYRWYKGEDEYTYYTMYTGKDSELVEFKK